MNNNKTPLIFFTLLFITSISFGQNLPKFISVQGGTFTMGDTSGLGNKDQQPTHQVTLKSLIYKNVSMKISTLESYIH